MLFDKQLEIERKFLMNSRPNLPIKEEHVVRQAYLYADDNIEVRLIVRYDADTYDSMQPCINRRKLTIKWGNGLERREAEIVLNEVQTAQLMQFVKGPFIEKHFTVYHIPEHPDLVFEFSSVDPNLETGFLYGEIEFSNKYKAQNFVLPGTIERHVRKEVTDETSYQMKNYWRRTRLGQSI